MISAYLIDSHSRILIVGNLLGGVLVGCIGVFLIKVIVGGTVDSVISYVVHNVPSFSEIKQYIMMDFSNLESRTGDHVNRLSRIPSLLPTEVGSGRLLWDDLISEVRRIKQDESAQGFVTDHVTQFVIDSAVLGRIPTRNSAHYFPKHENEYQGKQYLRQALHL